MLKKITIYIFILQIFVYIQSTTITWGLYFIFKDYITEKYCENKNNPMCGGKCQIAKFEGGTSKEKALPKFEPRLPEINPFLVNKLISSQNLQVIIKSFPPVMVEEETDGYSLILYKPPKNNILS